MVKGCSGDPHLISLTEPGIWGASFPPPIHSEPLMTFLLRGNQGGKKKTHLLPTRGIRNMRKPPPAIPVHLATRFCRQAAGFAGTGDRLGRLHLLLGNLPTPHHATCTWCPSAGTPHLPTAGNLPPSRDMVCISVPLSPAQDLGQDTGGALS